MPLSRQGKREKKKRHCKEFDKSIKKTKGRNNIKTILFVNAIAILYVKPKFDPAIHNPSKHNCGLKGEKRIKVNRRKWMICIVQIHEEEEKKEGVGGLDKDWPVLDKPMGRK
jgi:hypothetical protein